MLTWQRRVPFEAPEDSISEDVLDPLTQARALGPIRAILGYEWVPGISNALIGRISYLLSLL